MFLAFVARQFASRKSFLALLRRHIIMTKWIYQQEDVLQPKHKRKFEGWLLPSIYVDTLQLAFNVVRDQPSMVDSRKRKASSTGDLKPFEHTHLGAYFVGGFSFICIFYESVQVSDPFKAALLQCTQSTFQLSNLYWQQSSPRGGPTTWPVHVLYSKIVPTENWRV